MNLSNLINSFLITRARLTLKYKLLGKTKEAAEISYWIHEIENYLKWYYGSIPSHYGVPTPKGDEKYTQYSDKENAIRTWAKVHKEKYLKHLMIPENFFSDKTILDVGCGPIPYALVFTKCHIIGLDPLVEEYKKMGYPLDNYSERIKFCKGYAERIPFPDEYFDGVISVNSLDHVNNFTEAAQEMCRVLKQDGTIVFDIHYHSPKTTEPIELSDDTVLKKFGEIGIRKMHERTLKEMYPISNSDEKVVIWSNIGTSSEEYIFD